MWRISEVCAAQKRSAFAGSLVLVAQHQLCRVCIQCRDHVKNDRKSAFCMMRGLPDGLAMGYTVGIVEKYVARAATRSQW